MQIRLMVMKMNDLQNLDPVTFKPGWNGVPYNGDWIIANTLIPSRKLTTEEVNDMVEKILSFKTPTSIERTKDGVIVSFKGEL